MEWWLKSLPHPTVHVRKIKKMLSFSIRIMHMIYTWIERDWRARDSSRGTHGKERPLLAGRGTAAQHAPHDAVLQRQDGAAGVRAAGGAPWRRVEETRLRVQQQVGEEVEPAVADVAALVRHLRGKRSSEVVRGHRRSSAPKGVAEIRIRLNGFITLYVQNWVHETYVGFNQGEV